MSSLERSSSTNGFRVNRRGGAATNVGVNYENYMYLLILTRLLKDDRVQEFHIAQNVNGVGAFDDILVRVKYLLPGEEVAVKKLFLVQLKHIDNRRVTLAALTAATGGGDLKLKKYYDAYKLLLNKIGKFDDVILDECQMEDVTMVIYTNANCNLGDDNCPPDSLCRQLLQSGDATSNVFSFNSSKRYEKFRQELSKHKNPISEETDGLNFLQNLVIFAGQSNVLSLQEKLQNILKQYFSNDKVHLDHVLQNAVRFINNNSSMWMSLESGVLSDILFNFQGILVKLNDMKKLWGNKQICKNIIIRHICKDDDHRYVCIGKILQPTELYYIDRIVVKTSMMSDEDKQSLNDALDSVISPGGDKSDLATVIRIHKDTMMNEPLVLLSGSPGMGKSLFLSHQAELIKKMDPSKFVIREDLVEYSEYLNNIDENNKDFTKNFLMKIAGVFPNTAEYDAFQIALQSDYMMVVFLDGVDEISPYYYKKVITIIRTIRTEYKIQLWVSTRSILQQKVEMDIGDKSWELQKFSMNDTKLFFKKYCDINILDLGNFTESLYQIPMFCKMLGDLIRSDINKRNRLVLKLSAITSKVELYDQFVDVMYELYHKEKEKVDVNTAAARSKMEIFKNTILNKYENAALLDLFSKTELSNINFNMESNCKDLLIEISDEHEKMGFIMYNVDGKPKFIHRSIAEYFCGRWFAKNVEYYKIFVQKYKKFPLEVDYFMSTKLNNLDDTFRTILFVQNQSRVSVVLKEYAGYFNMTDGLDRNVVHYADISKNKNALICILNNGFTLTEEFIRNYQFNDKELESTFRSYLYFYWLESALLKYPELMPLLGIPVFVDEYMDNVKYFLLKYCSNCPLHVAILNKNKAGIIQFLDDNVNSINELGLTSLHVAVIAHDFDVIMLLTERGTIYSRNNLFGVYPHQVLKLGSTPNLKHLTIFEEPCIADIRNQNYESQNLPLHHCFQTNDPSTINLAAMNEVDFQKLDNRGRSALHVAAARQDVDLFSNICLNIEAFPYTKDNDGFYPHDYITHDFARKEGLVLHKQFQEQFKKYGFKTALQSLPTEDQQIFGKDVYYKW